ncbi:MAG TPA: YceI family protein [Gemmatimonadales bacterium]|nr:YceI family protein [Gemmatimonadales bacterium]
MKTLIPFSLFAGVLLLSASAAGPAHDAAYTYIVSTTGNEARYRVREQLAGFDFPNDAIGRTSAVTGAINFDENGAILPAGSQINIGVAGLTSDKERRDGFVRRRLLETDSFPTVTLALTGASGVKLPLAEGDSSHFTLTGNLTVKRETRPTTWQVSAIRSGEVVTGTATTAFTFADFGMEKPRVRSVLSVADTIKLEYDFRLEQSSTP